ncbi:MAG: RING finger protein [Candidatus Hodarchaeota archaeon]
MFSNKSKDPEKASKPLVQTSLISRLGSTTLLATIIIGILFSAQIKGQAAFIFRVAITTEILAIALGIVIDRLQKRGFEFWALGALVSYIGFLFLFSPLILYAVGLETLIGTTRREQLLWSMVFSLGGGFIVLAGYFVEAYDLNDRFVRKARKIIEAIRSANYRAIPGRILEFFSELARITFIYLWRGIKNLRRVIGRFLGTISQFIREYFHLLLNAIRAIPRTVKNLLNHFYEAARANTYVFVILGGFGAIFFYTPHLLISMGSITLFMAGLFFAYPRQEGIGQYIQAAQDRVWNAAWQTQAMTQRITRRKLSCRNCGTQLKVMDNFCAECGDEMERCQVCRLPIKPIQAVAHCSSCNSPFHESHWQQWQRMGKGCPICRSL